MKKINYSFWISFPEIISGCFDKSLSPVDQGLFDKSFKFQMQKDFFQMKNSSFKIITSEEVNVLKKMCSHSQMFSSSDMPQKVYSVSEDIIDRRELYVELYLR